MLRCAHRGMQSAASIATAARSRRGRGGFPAGAAAGIEKVDPHSEGALRDHSPRCRWVALPRIAEIAPGSFDLFHRAVIEGDVLVPPRSVGAGQRVVGRCVTPLRRRPGPREWLSKGHGPRRRACGHGRRLGRRRSDRTRSAGRYGSIERSGATHLCLLGVSTTGLLFVVRGNITGRSPRTPPSGLEPDAAGFFFGAPPAPRSSVDSLRGGSSMPDTVH